GAETVETVKCFMWVHDDRNCRGEDIGAVAADDDVDFVDIEQLAVNARHRRRVALVVVVNELHGSPDKTALGVGFLDPYFHREQRGFPVWPERTGLRNAKTDLDRLLVLRCHRPIAPDAATAPIRPANAVAFRFRNMASLPIGLSF